MTPKRRKKAPNKAKAPTLVPLDLGPTLIPLDLGRGFGSDHPDISSKKRYLCLIGKSYFAGKFTREWYGWNFEGWHGVGLQFDTPGTNASRWKAIWEIVEP